jgi:hypothetical protein
MWRWIIRVYVSFVIFWMLMFFHGAVLLTVARQMSRLGIPFLLQQIHSHVLLSMFLLGVLAGHVVVGSNITGRGWFRSKSGLTYEGFKLEKIKPWTWLIVSPVLLAGVALWVLTQNESGDKSNVTISNFYHGFLMPNCSSAQFKAYQVYPSCWMQLLFVGIWMASLGYSIAPIVHRQGTHLLRSLKHASETAVQLEAGCESSMKEKAEL